MPEEFKCYAHGGFRVYGVGNPSFPLKKECFRDKQGNFKKFCVWFADASASRLCNMNACKWLATPKSAV